ncbi:MAG: 50S ribosomal protein L10 [Patescibacteria group bacterium]|jgi:large subunit ribosomal protein L10
MPKSRAQKAGIVEEIAARFRGMKAAAFSEVSGLTMEDADKLRAKAALQNVEVFIAKKTLLAMAAKEAGIEGLSANTLSGSILTAVGMSDEVSAAKLLKELMKEKETIKLVAGVLDGRMMSKEEVTQLASLPSKQELLQKLVGTLNAPVSGFVNVLAGNLRGLVTVLGAINEKKA